MCVRESGDLMKLLKNEEEILSISIRLESIQIVLNCFTICDKFQKPGILFCIKKIKLNLLLEEEENSPPIPY